MAANITKPKGRPKGSKNKLTTITEAYEKKLIKSAGGLMLREVQAILETVVQRAKDGDMTAAKLILDRTIPATRSVDAQQAGGTNIQINIVGTENGINQTSSETDGSESRPTNGQIHAGAQGGEVITVNASTEG